MHHRWATRIMTPMRRPNKALQFPNHLYTPRFLVSRGVQQGARVEEIWDVLQTTHEGDEVTKITKRETIEGELGRFVLNKGEEPQAMYNRLKTMVNQVCNLRSAKWDDHEMVKVILRSLVFRNPTQVHLIHGDPRYKQMSPEEVIGKFVSFELMIKDSKHIVNLEQGSTSTP
jgi:hypothetical protein